MQDRYHVVLALALAGLAAGCGLEERDPGGTTPVLDTGYTPPTKVPAPSVDPLAQETCGSSIPITGKTADDTDVLVTGGAENAHGKPLPGSGRYCVDVKLNSKVSNTLSVFAHNTAGKLSTAVTVNVLQKKCGDDVDAGTPPPPKPKNVGLGAKAMTSVTPKSGNVSMLTDGKTGTPVVLERFKMTGTADIWVKITLDKVSEVEKVVVRWRDGAGSGDKHYATVYRLLTAVSPSTDPNITDGYWTEVSKITAGDGGTDTFDLKTQKPYLRHIALWLEEDGKSSPYQTFALTEIEVWQTAPKSTKPPPPKTKTCATLGFGP